MSLIAIGSGTASSLHTLFAYNTADVSQNLDLIPDFELAPLAEASSEPLPLESMRASSLDVDIAVPQSLITAEPELTQGATQAPAVTAEKRPAEEIAATLSSSSAQSVAAIQGRVGKAGGRQGEVQFALAWTNVNDVDLHVITPSGERISHQHRRSQCRGVLDVDMNVDGESTEPVENIRWLNNAPWGRYSALINLFQVNPTGRRVERSSEFELLAHLGSETAVHRDQVALGNQVAVFRFQYVPETVGLRQRQHLLAELAELQVQDERAAQPLLRRSQDMPASPARDRALNQLISNYPHTDAAIEAMRLLGSDVTKR